MKKSVNLRTIAWARLRAQQQELLKKRYQTPSTRVEEVVVKHVAEIPRPREAKTPPQRPSERPAQAPELPVAPLHCVGVLQVWDGDCDAVLRERSCTLGDLLMRVN